MAFEQSLYGLKKSQKPYVLKNLADTDHINKLFEKHCHQIYFGKSFIFFLMCLIFDNPLCAYSFAAQAFFSKHTFYKIEKSKKAEKVWNCDPCFSLTFCHRFFISNKKSLVLEQLTSGIFRMEYFMTFSNTIGQSTCIS